MDPRSRSRTRQNVQSISKAITNNYQMANYYRQTSYRRRYSRYRGKRSTVRGSARGELRGATQQRDSCRQVLKWSQTQSLKIKANSKEGSAGFSGWQALSNSGFYNNFAQMYDQVRINGIKIKITLLSASTALYTATNNPVFVSAWDRNGVSSENNEPFAPNFASCSSYGSAKTRPLTQGANFGVTRYIYASTMAEKSQYIATSQLPTWMQDYAPSADLPANVIPFKPTLLMAIYSESTTSSDQEFKFNVEWEFDLTFRGTRNDPNAISN